MVGHWQPVCCPGGISSHQNAAFQFGTGTNKFWMRGSEQQGLKTQEKQGARRARIHRAGQRCIGRPLDQIIKNHRADRSGHAGNAFSPGRQDRAGFNEPATRYVVRRIIRRPGATGPGRRHIRRVGARLGLGPATGHAAILRAGADRSHNGGKYKQGNQDMDRFGSRRFHSI
jgi:hypothetical protein